MAQEVARIIAPKTLEANDGYWLKCESAALTDDLYFLI